MADEVVKLEDVYVTFPVSTGLLSIKYFNAVDDVTLGVKKGRVLALIGESGSGKTTVGKITLGLIKPSRGRALFLGKDIFSMDKREYKEYRRNAQYIPQDPYASLHPFKTVRQVLGSIINYYELASTEEELEAQIEKALGRVGLNPPSKYINKYPFQLSGGERQRLSIARAIVLNPSYIVADEPVTMLDASIKAGIIKTLSALIRDMGTSLLFITHEVSLVQFFGADMEIAVMYLGKILERGSIRRILSDPCPSLYSSPDLRHTSSRSKCEEDEGVNTQGSSTESP